MCQLTALIDRYTTVLADHLGLPNDVIAENQQILIRDEHLTYHLQLRAPHDPELVCVALVLCGLPSDSDLPAAVAQVNRRAVAKLLLDTESRVHITTATVAAAPNTMPTEAHLTAVLPRAMAMIRHGLALLGEELQLQGILAANNEQRQP